MGCGWCGVDVYSPVYSRCVPGFDWFMFVQIVVFIAPCEVDITLRSGIAGALLAAHSFSPSQSGSPIIRFSTSKFALQTESTFLIVRNRTQLLPMLCLIEAEHKALIN